MLFRQLRAGYRLFVFILIVMFYMATAVVVSFFSLDSIQRRRRRVYNCHFYSRMMLKAFNIELLCKENIPEDEVSLLVGNHVGFIDIVCLQALRGCVFITSLEMKNTPVLGQITDLAGCAYVNRRNRMNIHKELKGITNVLEEGFRVVLYAESVASNGEQVLPFKKTLLMSAGATGRPIRPFVFNFRQVNGGPVLYSQRDSLCWYSDESFISAIWRSLQLDSVVCEIEFLPTLHPSSEAERTPLAEELHAMVSEKFVPFRPQMNQDFASNNLDHSL